MAKAVDPIKKLDEYADQINERIERWKKIFAEGCSDPFWPDGMNLNLVRNHIIYAIRQIRDLCDEFGLAYPDSAFTELPPKVSDQLYTGECSGDRYERISHYHKLVFPDDSIPAYEPGKCGQLSLF